MPFRTDISLFLKISWSVLCFVVSPVLPSSLHQSVVCFPVSSPTALPPLPRCSSVLHLGQIVPLYPRLSAKWDPHEYKLPITGSQRETGILDLTRLRALQRLSVIEKLWFCLSDFCTFLFEIKINLVSRISPLLTLQLPFFNRLTSKHEERCQSIGGNLALLASEIDLLCGLPTSLCCLKWRLCWSNPEKMHNPKLCPTTRCLVGCCVELVLGRCNYFALRSVGVFWRTVSPAHSSKVQASLWWVWGWCLGAVLNSPIRDSFQLKWNLKKKWRHTSCASDQMRFRPHELIEFCDLL